MSNTYYYKGANHTVDIILVSPCNKTLLIRRSDSSPACPGMLAFPGGFVDTEAKKGETWLNGKETQSEAALRELKEETGLKVNNPDNMIYVGTYEGNGRDPRDNGESWSRSQAYVYMLDCEEFVKMRGTEKGMDDASDAGWYNIEDKGLNLAFDHTKILKDSLIILNRKKSSKKKI